MSTLLYFPGCSLKTYAPTYEKSALVVLERLGYEIHELERWNCCGAMFNLTRDFFMHHIGAVRDLIRAQEASRKVGSRRLLVLCPLCYNVLARVNARLRSDPELYTRVCQFMDEEERYELGIEVVHLLEILQETPMERIKSLVRSRLPGLRVAVYYGCMVVRPKEVAVVDPEDPLLAERILEEVGVEVVDWPHKTECCGSYQVVANRDVTKVATKRVLESARDAGANAICVVCPLCHFNLTYAMERLRVVRFRMPVLYLTEILALVMGREDVVDKRQLERVKRLLRREETVSI